MSAASRGGNAMSALLRNSRRVCSQCARTTSRHAAVPLTARRHYVETASATPSSSVIPPPLPPPPPPASTITEPTATESEPETPLAATATPSTRYRIKSGIILTRPPLLTREQTPFEAAFYLYQKRLNERLAVPFRPAFYFRTDTASDLDWRIKIRERHGVPAKDIGRYNPRGRVAWNDEVLTGSVTSSPEEVQARLLADAEMRVSEDGEEIAEDERVPVERPMPRRTEADETGDARRLDRALDQTLYLVVKKGEGEAARWMFPTGDVTTSEALHETAARALTESAGVNMNTWVVGRVPVAHHITEPVLAEGEDSPATPDKRGEKVFFLKGRIMAGQADLEGNRHGLTDFKWLTKEELKETLPWGYYRSVRNMVELR